MVGFPEILKPLNAPGRLIVDRKIAICTITTVPTKYSASRRIRDLAGVLVTLLLALSNVLGNTVRVFGHYGVRTAFLRPIA